MGKRVLPSTFNHWPPITTRKAFSAAQLSRDVRTIVRHGRPRGGEARRGRGCCNHRAGRVRHAASPPSWAYRHAALHVFATWRSRTAVLNAIGHVAWARVSGGNDGGFSGSRRSLCEDLSFVAPWCHAASIAFGFSGAFVRAAPGICCGSRIQFHLARGKLRL